MLNSWEPTSESRYKMEWLPFPQVFWKSVGGLKKGWVPVDVFSTGWWQEGHLTSKSLHQLPLMECAFPPLPFLHCCLFSCMKKTWLNVVKEDVLRWRVNSRRQLANPDSPGRMAMKPACVCVSYILANAVLGKELHWKSITRHSSP